MIESKEEHAARLTGNERGILAQEMTHDEKTRHHWRPLLLSNEQMTELGMRERDRATACLDALRRIACLPNDAKPEPEPAPCEIQWATHEGEGDDGVRYVSDAMMSRAEAWYRLYFKLPGSPV